MNILLKASPETSPMIPARKKEIKASGQRTQRAGTSGSPSEEQLAPFHFPSSPPHTPLLSSQARFS